MLRICTVCALVWGIAGEDGSHEMDAEDGSHDMDSLLMGKDPERPGRCSTRRPCKVLDCCDATEAVCAKTCPYGVMTDTAHCGKIRRRFGGQMCKQDILPVPPCKGSGVPPVGTCKQPTKTNKKWGTCVMVDGRGDLPQASRDKTFDVSYLRKTIEGNDAKTHAMATSLNLFHSVVLIQETCADHRETFYIEFGADNFGPAVILPSYNKEDGSFAWGNSAYIGWYKSYNESDWQTNSRVFLGGGVSGSTVNAWLDEVPTWFADHPNYEMWSAFNSPGGDPKSAKQIFPDSQCHEFTEWSLQTLHDKGANFKSNQAICRNYANLYTAERAPRSVDVSDPRTNRQIATFYADLASHLKAMEADPTTAKKPAEEWVHENPHWFVVDQTNKQYFRIDLSGCGYFGTTCMFGKEALMPMQLSWQTPAVFGDGACLVLGPGREFDSEVALGSLQAAEPTITVV